MSAKVKRPKGRYDEFVESLENLSDTTPDLIERTKVIKGRISTLQLNIGRMKSEESDLNKELSAILNVLRNRRGFEVSDHAMIRYLERVKGFDIDSLKQRVSTYAKENPDMCVVSEDGFLITVKP